MTTHHPKVGKYRRQFHAQMASRFYVGWLHFAAMVMLSIGLIALSASQLDNVLAPEWLTLPAAFLYANLVEYFGHRYPMHHRLRGLGLIFERHSGQHHRFFTHEAMAFDDSDDFKAVLFPLALIVFYFAGIGVPTYLAVAWLFSTNVAWLFIATAVGYYCNYELLHFAYHTRPDSPLAFIPGMAALRRLHTNHHDPRLMQSYNFNITYPICDWLFGTLYKENRTITRRRHRRPACYLSPDRGETSSCVASRYRE